MPLIFIIITAVLCVCYTCVVCRCMHMACLYWGIYIYVDTCVWYDIGITSSIASCPVWKKGSSWTPAHWLTGQPATSRDLPVSTSSCPDSPRWSNPSPCLCSRLLDDWAVTGAWLFFNQNGERRDAGGTHSRVRQRFQRTRSLFKCGNSSQATHPFLLHTNLFFFIPGIIL